MKILLVGGNQEAVLLVRTLRQQGHEIAAVNTNRAQCGALTEAFGICAVCGDGTAPQTLLEAGIRLSDTVIALDGDDSVNLSVCSLARKEFRVPNIYSLVNDPQNLKRFKRLGVEKCVSTVRLFADLVEQDALEDNIKKYLPIEDGRVVICEVMLDGKSPALGKKLWELGFPPQSIISCIIRNGDTVIPQGNTVLTLGDKIVLIASTNAIDNALALLICTGRRGSRPGSLTGRAGRNLGLNPGGGSI